MEFIVQLKPFVHAYIKPRYPEKKIHEGKLDGNLLLKDSNDAREQEEFWDNKESTNKKLL